MPTPPEPRQAAANLLLAPGAPGRTLWMDVKGYSMFPTLRPKDQVEVEGIRPEALRLGDLAVLDLGETGWVIHRFFGWRSGNPPTPRTKGDASPRFDPPWPQARLLGRVRSVERDGRRRTVPQGWTTLPHLARSILVLVWARVCPAAPGGGA